MKFTKEKVLFLNDILKDVRKEKEKVIEVIENFCPREECNPNLDLNLKAKDCEYFTLCNVLCSYSLMKDEEMQKMDEQYNILYSAIQKRKNSKNNYSMFM